jgi:hypothetical protein
VSASKALALAVRALVPVGVTHYSGAAPAGAAMPRVVSNQSVPDVDSRSEAGGPLGQIGRVRLTVAAGTESGVLDLLDTVLPAFEGVRVSVTGWVTSPLRRVGEVRVYPDTDVTLTGGLHPVVGAALFEYTVTATP